MTDAAIRICPVCGRPALPALQPFCSRRCAEVDLGRWLTDQYAIPADAGDEPPAADPAPEAPA